MKIAIYGKETSFSLKEIIIPFLHEMQKRNIDVFIEEQFYEYLKFIPDFPSLPYPIYSNYNDFPNDAKLFFTFGGDGTILSAVTILQDKNIPIVGVNTGRLGYLAGINKDNLMDNLNDILSMNFNISERSLLSIEAENEDLEYNFALNEVSVMRKETTSMITVDAYIDREYLTSYWADGLIVATPTGSTGYSLSCNGPIIAPNTHNFVITPIAPHNLNVRPFIIPDEVTVYIKVTSREPNYSLTMDSRLKSLSTEQAITVKKANFTVKIAQLKEITYLETLRQKLYWGSDKRN